jgi:signal transduction histidine kinase
MEQRIVISSIEDEQARLEELYSAGLVGSEPEQAFDRITKLVARVFDMPICLVSLVTEDRQWFTSCVGLPQELEESRGTEREAAFCQHAVAAKKLLVVDDVFGDPRFASNRLVHEYGIRFYAGAPLLTKQGNVLGTLCLIDTKERTLDAEQQELLVDFSHWVMAEIEQRRDMLAKQRLSEELEQEKRVIAAQRDLIQRSFESAKEGKLLVSSDGTILLHNRRLLETFLINPGLYPNVIEFLTQVQLKGESSLDGLISKVKQLMNGENDTLTERFAVKLQGDQTKYYEMSGSKAEGRDREWYFSIRDRTEEERVDLLKNEFISVVSHELRTPLTSIKGFAEILLLRDPEFERRQKYVRTIHQESERLTELLNDFLDLQKMESGMQEYLLESTELVSLVQEVLECWQGKQTHQFQMRSGSDQIEVYADRDRLKQALHNLVSNAVKYSPASDKIDIDLLLEDGMVRICVRDYGLGIPEEAREKLFQKFYRVDNSDRRKIGGTGLGLAIVQEIITAHGGTVDYHSELGEGTTFVISLECSGEPLERSVRS